MTCPFIDMCTKLVEFKHFKDFCKGFSYPACERYVVMVQGFNTPKSWEKFMLGGGGQ
jgi:hypothetical protein